MNVGVCEGLRGLWKAHRISVEVCAGLYGYVGKVEDCRGSVSCFWRSVGVCGSLYGSMDVHEPPCVVITDQDGMRERSRSITALLSTWSIWCPTGGPVEQIQLILYRGLEKSS